MAISDDTLRGIGAEGGRRNARKNTSSNRNEGLVDDGSSAFGEAAADLYWLVKNHPGKTASVVLGGFIFSTIFINAAFLQDGAHPSPLFGSSQNIAQNIEVTDSQLGGQSDKQTMREVLLSSSRSGDNIGPRGDDVVRRVQTLLAMRGYYEDDIDGIPGSRTKKAVIRYQKAVGMSADGKINKILADHIALSSDDKAVHLNALSRVIREESVASVIPTDPKERVMTAQKRLSELGYGTLVVDGLIGEQTRQAIREFQLSSGLEITGNVSEGVLKKLIEIKQF